MYRKRELEWTIALLILIILAIVSYNFYSSCGFECISFTRYAAHLVTDL